MNKTWLSVVAGFVALSSADGLQAQTRTFGITVDPAVHGKVQVTPPVPQDRAVEAGTVLTITATPDPGYVLDSLYYSLPGRFPTYRESMGTELKVPVDGNKRIGASFIEASAVAHIDVKHGVVYAKPGAKPLNVAPLSHIPKASDRSVPMYLVRGTRDVLISNTAVFEFVDALVKQGHRVQYVQVGAANHAFFDWKPDNETKATFQQFGVYYAAEMKAFFTSILY